MVSVIAAHMRNRREYKTLTDLFDKADVSGDGAVSLEEFMDVAKHFGIMLTEEETIGFVKIAKKGKVRFLNSSSHTTLPSFRQGVQS